jgi:oxidase EvaA
MKSKHILVESRKWQKEIKKLSNLHIKKIPFNKSHEWLYDGKTITHKTGRFFQVIGVRSKYRGVAIEMPLIKQTDIGILGFLTRRKEGKMEILIQAKTEPGNFGITQLAPTCQATASNIARAHHGGKPYFASWFTDESKRVLYSSLQSEQGTRFYHKKNRNVLIEIDHTPKPDPYHRWYSFEDILSLVHEDYLLNTDTRSVLVCSPWRKMLNRLPFARFEGTFSQALLNSYITYSENKIKRLKKLTAAKKKTKAKSMLIPLSELTKWKSTASTIQSKRNADFKISQIAVEVVGREVPHWDQPFFEGVKRGKIKLYCGTIKGTLHFLFNLVHEPGFYNKFELTPGTLIKPTKRKVLAKFTQSEEGGRFMKEINEYRLIDIGIVTNKAINDCWLTLGEIEALLKKSGIFTNEARSAISIILRWM